MSLNWEQVNEQDDMIFQLLFTMNEHFDIGVDFENIEQSELLIEARGRLLDLLKERTNC